jgi:hypothetical protein
MCLQVYELAEAIGSKRGPPGFMNHWERRPAILIVNKADLLIDHPGEVHPAVSVSYTFSRFLVQSPRNVAAASASALLRTAKPLLL